MKTLSLAVIALAAFNLIACAPAEPANENAELVESPTTFSDSPRVAEAKATAVGSFAAEKLTAPRIAEAEATAVGSFAAETLVPSFEECHGRYSCSRDGQVVIMRFEGESCMLGDVVLNPDFTAVKYREEYAATTWSADPKLAIVDFHDALGTSRCERRD